MNYEEFKFSVGRMFDDVKDATYRFEQECKKGIFKAFVKTRNDSVLVLANRGGNMMTVRWGNGHMGRVLAI